MEKLRILCVECFNQIVNIKKGIAICSCCNAEYNIAEKSTQFKVRLSGGFIKTSLSYDDIVLGIKTGSILAGDYIASVDGPWIHVYDSSFEYYFKKIDEQDNRSGIILYKKKKKKCNLYCPYTQWSTVKLPVASPLKKTESFPTLARSHQLWRATFQHPYHSFQNFSLMATFLGY